MLMLGNQSFDATKFRGFDMNASILESVSTRGAIPFVYANLSIQHVASRSAKVAVRKVGRGQP